MTIEEHVQDDSRPLEERVIEVGQQVAAALKKLTARIDTITDYQRRSKWTIRILVVCIIGLAGLTVNQRLDTYHNCGVSNGIRATNLGVDEYLIGQVTGPTNKLPPKVQEQIASIEVRITKSLAPTNCSLI